MVPCLFDRYTQSKCLFITFRLSNITYRNSKCISCAQTNVTYFLTKMFLFSGCYYQYQYYEEGEQIRTSEPCLNCTCHNQMLMCYLRVCPFIKPVGKNCVVEKRDDQCCPTIMCPEGNHYLKNTLG